MTFAHQSSSLVRRLFALAVLTVTVGMPAATHAQNFSGFPGSEARYLPPGGYPSNPWTLGVRVNNTAAGVQLTSIVPGSAAAAAGLEAGDTILTVGGQQVGYVDDRLIDLGDAVAQFAGTSGRVTLLIQNGRNGQVVNVPVQLGGGGGGGGGGGQTMVQGQVIYTARPVGMSRQAVLNVRMVDTTHQNWSSVVVAETSVAGVNRQPIVFRLNVNLAQVFPNHSYALEAEVVDRGQVTHRTNVAIPYNPSASNVILTLAPVATTLPILPGGAVVDPWGQVSGWYQQYLGRAPTAVEEATWRNHLRQGRSLDEVQSYLLGSSEYYERSRNDPQTYVRDLHRSIHGTEPTPTQAQAWTQQLQEQRGVRSRFVQGQLSTRGQPQQ